MKVVIVGGVAGGATAAARLRRLDEKAEIIIFERSGYVSYANCGLPYYIGGEIPDKEDLFLQTPEGFWNRFRIDVRTLHEVISINRGKKTVTVKDKTSGDTFEESYDKLLEEGDYTRARKTSPVPVETISTVFWLVTVAIYLGWSFSTNDWEISWIIWPVAGVLFAALSVILNSIASRSRRS